MDETWIHPCIYDSETKGRKFSSTEEATLAADWWFAAQPKEIFLVGLKKFEQRSHKCVELRGEYVE
jgi:hypothetical protein